MHGVLVDVAVFAVEFDTVEEPLDKSGKTTYGAAAVEHTGKVSLKELKAMEGFRGT